MITVHLTAQLIAIYTLVRLPKCALISAVDCCGKLMKPASSVLFLGMSSPHMQVICYDTLRDMPGSYQGTPLSQVLDVVRK
jgi:hypothetical protein